MLRKRFRGDFMKLFSKENLISLFLIIVCYIIGKVLIDAGIINSYILLNIVIIGVNIILAVSLNLITGFTGQFSLGHAAFMSIGAYTSAVMTVYFNLPFAAAMLISAVFAAVAGLIIGIPTLRLKGDYLAIATLGFGEIVRVVALNMNYIGGASGFNDIPQYTNWTWLYFMVVISIVLIKNFINSYEGRACIAIGQDEVAAEAMGVNTTYYKVLAFIVGAFFAGIAGSLYANYFYFIKPDSFGFMKSIDILVIVVFGGMGSITGSIIGAIVLSVISLFLQNIPELRMVIYSLILFLIMIYRPKGLLGNKEFKLFRKGSEMNAGAQSK